MIDYYQILDNEKKLNELNFANYLHSIIHAPQQLLYGYELAKKTHLPPPKNLKIKACLNHKYKILENWLQFITESVSQKKNSLQVMNINIYNSSDQTVMEYSIKKDADNHIKGTLSFSAREILIDTFLLLGAAAGLIEQITSNSQQKFINELAALLMNKAGALTWRVPLTHNYAKQLAVQLCKSGFKIISGADGNFQKIADSWQTLFRRSAVAEGENEFHLLPLFKATLPGTIPVFGDGSSYLQNLVSLYQLGLITAAYCAIINNIKYTKKD